MELNHFIGKTVIGARSKNRYTLKRITASYVDAVAQKPNENGCCPSYRWETINGDPITKGVLLFEDASLTEPFQTAYQAYCHTREAYYEDIDYWMRKD